MKLRKRRTWEITSYDLPPDWIVEREPRLAAIEENALFRLIHHRRALGRMWGRPANDSRMSEVFFRIPRGALDDLLMVPLPKGEFARAAWASAVTARHCNLQRAGAWIAGFLGAVIFLFCEALRTFPNISIPLASWTQNTSALGIAEFIAGALLAGSVIIGTSLRHLPHGSLGDLYEELRKRRFVFTLAIDPAKALRIVLGNLSKFVSRVIRVSIYLSFAGLGFIVLVIIAPKPSAETLQLLGTLASLPTFWLLVTLALVASITEALGRRAYYRADRWFNAFEREALWLQECVRLMEHEPSDRAALRRFVAWDTRSFDRRGREL